MWLEDKYKEGFCALLVFMRGAEGVEKPETESRPKAGRRRSSARSDLEAEDFQLPQEQGKTGKWRNYLFQKVKETPKV